MPFSNLNQHKSDIKIGDYLTVKTGDRKWYQIINKIKNR